MSERTERVKSTASSLMRDFEDDVEDVTIIAFEATRGLHVEHIGRK